MSAAILFYATGEVAHQLGPLFFAEKAIPLAIFGWITVAIFGLSFIGSRISHILTDKFGDKNTILITIILLFFILIAATQLNGIIAGFVIALGSLFWGIRQPIISHYYHTLATDKQRATIISIGQLANQLGLAIAAPIFGLIADIITVTQTFLIISLIYIPILFLIRKLPKVV